MTTRYDSHAFMMNEEGLVAAGLLASLSSIETAFDLQVSVLSALLCLFWKEVSLDHTPVGVIDLSTFLKAIM